MTTVTLTSQYPDAVVRRLLPAPLSALSTIEDVRAYWRAYELTLPVATCEDCGEEHRRWPGGGPHCEWCRRERDGEAADHGE